MPVAPRCLKRLLHLSAGDFGTYSTSTLRVPRTVRDISRNTTRLDSTANSHQNMALLQVGRRAFGACAVLHAPRRWCVFTSYLQNGPCAATVGTGSFCADAAASRGTVW
jgi:hypothetical protein